MYSGTINMSMCSIRVIPRRTPWFYNIRGDLNS
jgi:hypothetical protein